jgi:hypothetical protein
VELSIPVKSAVVSLSTSSAVTCVCKRDWPFLMLPPSRAQFYDALASGTIPCPYSALHAHESDGPILPSGPVAKTGKSGSPRASLAPAPKDKEKLKGDAKATALTEPVADVYRHSQADVDYLFVREVLLRLASLRERHPHGIAAVRLNGLLRDVRKGATEIPVTEDSASLVPRNRLFIPATPEPLWALNEQERLCQCPGAYNVCSSRLKVRCSFPFGIFSCTHRCQRAIRAYGGKFPLP